MALDRRPLDTALASSPGAAGLSLVSGLPNEPAPDQPPSEEEVKRIEEEKKSSGYENEIAKKAAGFQF